MPEMVVEQKQKDEVAVKQGQRDEVVVKVNLEEWMRAD